MSVNVSACPTGVTVLGAALLSLTGPVIGQTTDLVFATEVREVRSSSVDGNHVLTLEINDITGPIGCKSSTVMLHSSRPGDVAWGSEIEAIALRALLSSEAVVLSVPTGFGACIDGKPTVSDLWLMTYE